MGIRSEPFRGVVLSGDDITRFEQQVESHVPNQQAVATVARGMKLAAEYAAKGSVTVQIGPRLKTR